MTGRVSNVTEPFSGGLQTRAVVGAARVPRDEPAAGGRAPDFSL